MIKNNKPIHILRYGTVAEKVHLEKAISSYDYLSINGNSAAYVSSAIAKFVVEKFFSKPDKGYFIDPITYAFQDKIELLWSKSKATGEENIKKSVKKLIETYKFPATKAESKAQINVTDFDDAKMDTFCHNVLSFQYNLVYDHINQNDLQKYLDYISPEQSKNLPQLRPKFLIAPYFYLDPQDTDFQEWLRLNVEFLKMSVSKSVADFSRIDIFGQIVLNKSILFNSDLIEKITNAYSNIDCAGFTIWVDDLNEHEASKEELEGFVTFLRKMKEKNQKPIFNMYGGYFSILLAHKDLRLLSGVSHGLEYGETRKVYPVGGGIPVSKYYYYPLHQRTDFTKAFYLLEHADIVDLQKDNWGTTDKYFSEICKCEQCKKIMGKEMINFVEFESREFYEVKRKDQILRRKKASSDTKQNCLYHYLLCKKIEFSSLSKFPLNTLIDELYNSGLLYADCMSVKEDELAYTKIWRDVLSKKQ